MKMKYKRVKIGTVGVDSGQLILIDPCYIKYEKGLHNPKDWEIFCDKRALADHEPQDISGGLAFSTAWGDGGYDVIATKDNDGRILSITVNFE